MTLFHIDQDALTTRRITDFTQVELLYQTRMKNDFVRNELKPLSSIRRAWKKNSYDCYGLFDGDEILGYAFFVRLGNNLLFDYLAIAEKYRDSGLGSIFLRQLADCLADADCVVGEVEDPEQADDADIRALRERRLQFYLRNGYLKTDLTSTVFGVNYWILEIPVAKSHTTEELRAVYTDIYRNILPLWFFRRQFHVV